MNTIANTHTKANSSSQGDTVYKPDVNDGHLLCFGSSILYVTCNGLQSLWHGGNVLSLTIPLPITNSWENIKSAYFHRCECSSNHHAIKNSFRQHPPESPVLRKTKTEQRERQAGIRAGMWTCPNFKYIHKLRKRFRCVFPIYYNGPCQMHWLLHSRHNSNGWNTEIEMS